MTARAEACAVVLICVLRMLALSISCLVHHHVSH